MLIARCLVNSTYFASSSGSTLFHTLADNYISEGNDGKKNFEGGSLVSRVLNDVLTSME